ncbi:hypothetical protein ACVIGB_000956 [Bradyrhizobium sp. USDA 4341]
MRFHLTSLDRAKRVADKLTRILDETLDVEISRAEALEALARMLGYDDWAELKAVTERHDMTPSPFDERLEPADLRGRLAGQAEVLGDEFDVDEGLAAEIVAILRATAHPAGPHRVFGPSSLPPPGALEYRGHGPDGPIVDGLPRPGRDFFIATQDVPAMKRDDDAEPRSIIANTSTKIFMRLDEPGSAANLVVDSLTSSDPSDAVGEQASVAAESLRGLGVGEGFVAWHDRYFRTSTFRAPEGGEAVGSGLRTNHFLRLPQREDDGSPPPAEMTADVFMIRAEGEREGRLMVGDPKPRSSFGPVDGPLTHQPRGLDHVRAITQSLMAGLPRDLATLPEWLSEDPGFNAGLSFLRKLNGLPKNSVSGRAQRPTVRTGASCVFGDVEVDRDGHSIRVSARMKTGEDTMEFKVEIDGNRHFPRIHAYGGCDLASYGFDDTEMAGETAFEWSFLRTLRICGLYEPSGTKDPFGLARFSHGPDDLGEATDIWRTKLAEAGVDTLRPLVDAAAIDALLLCSEAPFRDERAYHLVRDIHRNADARKALLTYPMIFNEIWSSPELWDTSTSLQGLRRRLIETGLSLKNTDYGDWLSLPPLPEWLVDWLSCRTYRPGPRNMHSYSRHVRDAVVMLSVLGPDFAPATEADWQAMKMLVEAVDSVRDPDRRCMA